MEISKTYNPTQAEAKWYPYWLEKQFFKSTPDNRIPYTIVIPPPNVTGVLHMGHMLNNTIQDVLIRRARMLGFNACWVPGTDHASIATEAKVVALLKEKGINKKDLSREEFLKHAWDWKEKYGGIILEQLKKLGASCDWDRTKFTMDADLSEAVIDAFIDLYNKGKIYRGVRMVNWDPQGLTAVSDEEVIYKEKDGQLVYINYKIQSDAEPVEATADASIHSASNYITIATTRPETIMADTAVCVNPNDERYQHLKGKKVIIPLINKAVPIIFDEYVDAAFGTGALKVTPAHDINDFNLGQKHKLPTIDGLTQDGKISEAAQIYVGMDRFACRKQIVKDLQEQGFVTKIETIKNKVGHSERTDAVIEPRLSMQWFLKMEDISKPALEAVLNNDVKLIPEKFINTYKHWMENVHDWCISRQLWWGQRIPAWYDGQGNTVVAKTKEAAFNKLRITNYELRIEDVKQDDDVLDTWFSSWLWPLTVFDANVIKNGFKNANEDLKYYYPTNDLVTAPEILFFWVARMIIAGKEYTGLKPFTNVYLTGIVRDKLGRKMSKSLGNSPDPLELIKKYGADGVRVGMLLCSPAGNDLMFDESYCEQGRNFANKVWNAFRLINGFEIFKSETEILFEKDIDEFIENKKDRFFLFNLGKPISLLINIGFSESNFILTQSVLNKILNKHEINLTTIKQLPYLINSPILVLNSATEPNGKVIISNCKTENKILIIAIHLNKEKDTIEVHEVMSVHNRDIEHIYNWIEKDLAVFAQTKKVQNLLCVAPYNSERHKQILNLVTKVQNFDETTKFSSSNLPQSSVAAITWFENKLSEQLEIINDHYSKYRMSDALMATYKLVWDDFCAWYLEAIKPEFVDGISQPIDKTTYDATINFLESLLKIMHPWMPFITEEIWHLLKERNEKECIIVAEWPKQLTELNSRQLAEFEVVKELVAMVRNVRAQKQLSPKEKLEVIEKSDATKSYFDDVVIKLANLSAFNYTDSKIEGAFSFQLKTTEFFIPLSTNINPEEEKQRLIKELEYNKGFLESVLKKLSNEKFVANAKPEILEVERKKESDALSKIKSIEEQLASL